MMEHIDAREAIAAPQTVRTEVLRVLRARLAPYEVAGAASLHEWLALDPRDPDLVRHVTSAITRAIARLPSDLQHATKLMCGLVPETAGARTTRSEILDLMARSLRRMTSKAVWGQPRGEGVPLTRRRVLMIERDEIVPAVIMAMAGDPRGEDPYGAAEIRVSLRASEQPAELIMTVVFSVDFDGSRWVVGVTGEEFVVDVVAGMTLAVNDMSCPGRLTSTTVLPRMHVAVRSSSDRKVRHTPTPFRPATVEEIVELTAEPRLATLGEIHWFIADLVADAERSRNPGPFRVTVTKEYEISLLCRYCFWNAPRRMYVSRVVIDASAFPRREQWHFSVQPFLGVHAEVDGGEEHGMYEVHLDTWLNTGNGVALIWGDKADA